MGWLGAFVKDSIDPETIKSLLTKGGPPPAGAMLPFDQIGEFKPLVPHTALPRTDVMPYLAAPIEPGRNLVYCATFQLLWDVHRQQPLVTAERSPSAMTRGLNCESFDAANLDPESYIARAVNSSTEERVLRDELDQRFPNSGVNVADSDFPAAYAFLQKTLPFAIKFERMKAPLMFKGPSGDVAVTGFGVKEGFSDAIKRQVEIVDFDSPDDFVVQLRTRSDLITLAKIEPAETLAETVSQVEQRVAATRRRSPTIEVGELLVIPDLSLSVDRDYPELQPPFVHARQFIRFLLNESGAKLVSGGEARMISEAEPVFMGARKMVFDKPFLLMLHEPDATQPYLARWIENADLMLHFTPP